MKFAFIIHPLQLKDVAKKYPLLKFVPDPILESIVAKKQPVLASNIKGIESITGEKLEGCFIACPLTPKLMLEKLPLETVYERLIKCTEIAKNEGAEIIGLGAFTAIVGDGGATIAKNSPIAVTTGNSYTVASSIEGALKACADVGIEPQESTLAVVGATGSIGKTCAEVLAPRFQKTYVIGRDEEKTKQTSKEIPYTEPTTSFDKLKEADLVITVTSSDAAVIQPEHLKSGSVVCDVARPRDVSHKVVKKRHDVLVIEGGVISIPGNVDFGIDFGFPSKTAYACMSETMLLALEKRAENYTIGKNVNVNQVTEMQDLAIKHGFKLAGFRSFEKALTNEKIDLVKKARKNIASKTTILV